MVKPTYDIELDEELMHNHSLEDIKDLTNPIQFKGAISLSSEFPTSTDVQNGWFYQITADVTDNDVSKTNTGQSFQSEDEIVWNGTNWTVLGNTKDVDYIKFEQTPTKEIGERELGWNETDGTLNLGMPGNITQQIGQEMFIKVRNASGSLIEDGTPVYFDGRQGNRAKIYPARSDSESTCTVMGVTTQDIANNSDGYITTFGYVRQIKTNYTGTGDWGTTWEEGDNLYVSKTVAGQLTNVEPGVPHCSDIVGEVGIVGAVGIGSIFVNIDRHRRLTELADVNGTPLTENGQIMVWDEDNQYFDFTSNINDYAQKSNVLELDNTTAFTPDADYEPATKKYVDDEIAGVPTTSPGGSDTQVQFNDDGAFGGDSNFVWDNTIKSLILGVDGVSGGDFTVTGNNVYSSYGHSSKLVYSPYNFNFTAGDNCEATGVGSIAMGASSISPDYKVIANGTGCFSINGHAIGTNSIAIGRNSKSAAYDICIGPLSVTTGQYNVSIGFGAKVTDSPTQSVAIGYNATVNGSTSVAVGSGAVSSALQKSVVIGYNITNSIQNSILFGIDNNNLLQMVRLKGVRIGATSGETQTMTGTDLYVKGHLEVDGRLYADENIVAVGTISGSNLSGTNTGDQDLTPYAQKSNVLELDNTTEFTPTTDYHPATKKYVDDNAGGEEIFERTSTTITPKNENDTLDVTSTQLSYPITGTFVGGYNYDPTYEYWYEADGSSYKMEIYGYKDGYYSPTPLTSTFSDDESYESIFFKWDLTSSEVFDSYKIFFYKNDVLNRVWTTTNKVGVMYYDNDIFDLAVTDGQFTSNYLTFPKYLYQNDYSLLTDGIKTKRIGAVDGDNFIYIDDDFDKLLAQGGIYSKSLYDGFTIPSGAGSRYLWIPSRNAFRAGSVSGTQWDEENIGPNSFAVGSDTQASGQSFAAGLSNTASGLGSFAVGAYNTASGIRSFVGGGNSNTASGNFSAVFGQSGLASAYFSTHLGRNNIADVYASLTVGLFSKPLGGSATGWVDTDPLVYFGNGISTSERSNSMVIYKAGNFDNIKIYQGSTLGTEKLTNGDFTGSATGWTLASGWTYNTNLVRKDGAGVGTLTQPAANMVTPIIAGEVYTLTYTISSTTSGGVRASAGGVPLTWRYTDGTFTETFKALTTDDLAFTPFATSSRFYIDTISLKRVSDGDLFVGGNINANSVRANSYESSDGSSGATGTFTTADSKTVTVKNGLITSIV